MLPTLLSLANIPFDHPIDGIDLSAPLLGEPIFERGIAVPNTRFGDAFRSGRWKLVRRYSGDAPLPVELYDLETDLGERTDLAAVYPDTVAMLLDQLPYGQPLGGNVRSVKRLRAPLSSRSADPESPTLRVFPNPAGATTAAPSVVVALEEAGALRVEVFDLLGRRLAVLWDGKLELGRHRFALPTSTSGTVVVRATGPFGVRTAKLTCFR